MKSLGQILLSTALVLSLFSGCTKQPEPVKKVKIDPTLPGVSINGYLTDMNAIAFEWKPLSDPRVTGVYIYRSNPKGKDAKLHRISTIQNRYATHYTDATVKPDTRYQYRFSTYKKNLEESNAGETITVNTLPVLASVSFFASVGNMPRSAKLVWRPHTNVKVKHYSIERQTLEDPQWVTLGTIQGRLSAEYIDMDLKDNHIYKYRLRAVTFDGIVSTPSQIVQVVTKPLPVPITGLSATRDLPRKITLNWQPSQREDFSHYNIYRSRSPKGGFDYHVKLYNNSFSDTVKEDGKTWFYKVTAVDKDGLESERASVALQGSTLPKPKGPVITEARYSAKGFNFRWKSNDERIVSYILIKTVKKSWVSKSVQEITGITQMQYTDADIMPDVRYEYQLVALDLHGIRSEPTDAIELSYEAK